MMYAVESPKQGNNMIQPMPPIHPCIEAEQDEQAACWFGDVQAVKDAEIMARAPRDKRRQSSEGKPPIHQRQAKVARRMAPARSRVCELRKMWKCGLRNPQQDNADRDGQWLGMFHGRKIGTPWQLVQPFAERVAAIPATFIDNAEWSEAASCSQRVTCVRRACVGAANASGSDNQFYLQTKLRNRQGH